MIRNLRTLILLLGLNLAPVQASPNFNICRHLAGTVFGPPPSLLPKAGDQEFQIVKDNQKARMNLFLDSVLPPQRNIQNLAWWSYDTLHTPLVEESHLFRDRPVPAALSHSYKVSFNHRQTRAELMLILPVGRKNRPLPNKFLAKIERALKQLPSVILREVNFITINPYPHHKDAISFFSSKTPATAWHMNKSVKLVELFPASVKQGTDSELLGDLHHELGHIMALAHYKSFTPNEKWLEATLADGIRVSEYGETSLDEDFAEAMKVYLATEGGLKAPHTRRQFLHRFAILDEILEVDRDLLWRGLEGLDGNF